MTTAAHATAHPPTLILLLTLPLLPPQARAILSRFDANHDHKLDLQEFTELVRRVRHEQAAAAHPAAGSLPALRAAFGSYVVHGDHLDRVAVTDLRSALLRAGVDANSRVALAAFAELQRTGRTHVDFDAFLRVANAVAAHSTAHRDSGAPKPTVPPSPPGAAPPPTGAPPSAAWSTWSEIPDDLYAVRPAALVGGGSAAATAAAAPAAAAPSSYPTAAYPPQPAHAAPPSALAAYRGGHRRRADPAVAEGGAGGAADARLWGSTKGPGSPPSTGGSSAKKGAVTAEAKRISAAARRGGRCSLAGRPVRRRPEGRVAQAAAEGALRGGEGEAARDEAARDEAAHAPPAVSAAPARETLNV